MNKWGKFWAVAGPLIALPAALYFTIQITQLIGKDEFELEAKGSEEVFEYPDSVQVMITDYYINKYKQENDSIYWMLAESRASVNADTFIGFNKMVRIKVRNVGEKECTGLQLRAGQGGYYKLNSPKATGSFLISGIIELGSLQPTESLELTIWSGYRSLLDIDNLRLTHTNGHAKVEFPTEVTGLLAFLSGKGIFILSTIPLLLYIIYGLVELTKHIAKRIGIKSE